jgi:uncharacterized OsmC-like protein
MTAEIVYQGELRTQATHLRSGQSIITDAPVDNHGKGEAFSPTDLVSAALVSCMLSVLGIQMQQGRLPELGIRGTVAKGMAAEGPRRIVRLDVALHISGTGPLTDTQRKLLEATALSCPVALSLHPDIQQHVVFHYA